MKSNKQNDIQDIIIIGGGIMGLMTAYYASDLVKNITILEKKTIGKENKDAASFSYTRSIRADYPDQFYTRLANESQKLWNELESKSKKKFYIKSGCLNIAKKSITPAFKKTYAGKSYATRLELNLPTRLLDKTALKKRFPQFNVDFGSLEDSGGFLLLQEILELLLNLLKQKSVTIKENITVESIEEKKDNIIIKTDKETFEAKKIIISAGLGTNNLIRQVNGNKLQFPITQSRPKENKYYYPEQKIAKLFYPKNFPVFAYLDTGIYGHPVFNEKKGALKIGYYESPEIQKKRQTKIQSVEDFVNECLPALKNVPSEDVNDVDQCSYDLVFDNNFIMGNLPGYKNIIIGTGWCGTGYKFAPLVGKILSQLALQNGTVYNIQQFSPARFT